MKSIKRSAWGVLISKVLMYLFGCIAILTFILLASEVNFPEWKEILWRVFFLIATALSFSASAFFWKLSEECENNLEKLLLREKHKGIFHQKMRELQ